MTTAGSIDSWTAKRDRFVPRGVAVTHPIAIARAEGAASGTRMAVSISTSPAASAR